MTNDIPDNDPGIDETTGKNINLEEIAEKIRLAMIHFEPEKLLQYLDLVPDDFPFKSEYKKWALDEINRAGLIEEAIQRYDGIAVAVMLQDLPDDYPNLEAIKKWLIREAERKAQLEKAVQAHDGQKVLRLLEDVSEAYPGYLELKNQAEINAQRASAINQAYSQGNWTAYINLLLNAPEAYPNRTELIEKAKAAQERSERYQQLARQVKQAVQQGDWREVQEICRLARRLFDFEDSRAFTEASTAAERELEKTTRVERIINQASQEMDRKNWTAALDLLTTGQALAPYHGGIRERIEEVKDRIARQELITQVAQALNNGHFIEALQILDRIQGDEDVAPLRQEARTQQIADLNQKAQAAESSGNWFEAQVLLQSLKKIGHYDSSLDRRIQKVNHELRYANLLNDAQKEMLEGHNSRAKDLLNLAAVIFPDRPDHAALLQEINSLSKAQNKRRSNRLLIGLFILLVGGALILELTGNGLLAGLLKSSTPTPTLTKTAMRVEPTRVSPSQTVIFTPTSALTETATLTATSTPSPSPTASATTTLTRTPTRTRTATVYVIPFVPTDPPTATSRPVIVPTKTWTPPPPPKPDLNPEY